MNEKPFYLNMDRKLIFSFHHLYYTDDLLLLEYGSQHNARGIAGVLHHLVSFTGQVGNIDKSSPIKFRVPGLQGGEVTKRWVYLRSQAIGLPLDLMQTEIERLLP